MITRVSGCAAMIARVASTPSITGIEMSMSTMSGRSSSTTRIASSPLAASPMVSHSAIVEISSLSPRRTTAWSSTMTMRTVSDIIYSQVHARPHGRVGCNVELRAGFRDAILEQRKSDMTLLTPLLQLLHGEATAVIDDFECDHTGRVRQRYCQVRGVGVLDHVAHALLGHAIHERGDVGGELDVVGRPKRRLDATLPRRDQQALHGVHHVAGPEVGRGDFYDQAAQVTDGMTRLV